MQELLPLRFAIEEDDSNRSIKIFEKWNLTSKQISKAMCLIDKAMDIFLNTILRAEGVLLFQVVAANINCYKDIYFTLKKICSQTLEQYFVKKADLRRHPLWFHQNVIKFNFVFHKSIEYSSIFCLNCIFFFLFSFSFFLFKFSDFLFKK